MAEVMVYIAEVQVGDSAKHKASASVFVGATDAKAWFAAADKAARDASKVGLLLDATLDMMEADGTTGYKSKGVSARAINDAFAFPSKDADIYNSNKWKVTYTTTNAGIPATESIYIPQHTTGQAMESNGVNADISTGDASAYITQLLDTGISSFQTAILTVTEILVNDS